jgi:hypothetical protein
MNLAHKIASVLFIVALKTVSALPDVMFFAKDNCVDSSWVKETAQALMEHIGIQTRSPPYQNMIWKERVTNTEEHFLDVLAKLHEDSQLEGSLLMYTGQPKGLARSYASLIRSYKTRVISLYQSNILDHVICSAHNCLLPLRGPTGIGYLVDKATNRSSTSCVIPHHKLNQFGRASKFKRYGTSSNEQSTLYLNVEKLAAQLEVKAAADFGGIALRSFGFRDHLSISVDDELGTYRQGGSLTLNVSVHAWTRLLEYIGVPFEKSQVEAFLEKHRHSMKPLTPTEDLVHNYGEVVEHLKTFRHGRYLKCIRD